MNTYVVKHPYFVSIHEAENNVKAWANACCDKIPLDNQMDASKVGIKLKEKGFKAIVPTDLPCVFLAT